MATSPSASEKNTKKLAIVLVRGVAKGREVVKGTLRLLRLDRKNHCVVVADTPSVRGMLQQAKDYLTWGEITPDMERELVEKRGQLYKGRLTDSKGKYSYHRTFDYNGKKYKPYFALQPPQKGFGRKGIKVAFRAGGALGYRGEKMNDLLKRML
ncbi:uL30 family ribosomal protein [Candidatus Woesearchaeota archaeon]|nr:uL30 family ribosomal protein [Candidatus Woesearchaeota archaeon]